MEYFNKIKCVSVDDLTSGDNPVMTYVNYENIVKRQQVNVVRPGKGLDSYALIEYSSLPERFRFRFEALKGKPEELLKDGLIPETIRLNMEARDFFASFRFNNGDFLPVEKQEEYTLNASVLDELIRELNDRSSFRKACGKQSTKLLWQSRKVYADVYIDDHNLGGLPTWHEIYDIISGKVKPYWIYKFLK